MPPLLLTPCSPEPQVTDYLCCRVNTLIDNLEAIEELASALTAEQSIMLMVVAETTCAGLTSMLATLRVFVPLNTEPALAPATESSIGRSPVRIDS
jgi:hypothetical protein